MKLSQILNISLTIALITTLAACQNDNERRGKSRLDRGVRAVKITTEATDATDIGNDKTSISSTTAQHCKPGADFAELCNVVLVSVDENDNISGLEKEDLINQGEPRAIQLGDARPKDNKVHITAKNARTREHTKALMVFAFAQAPKQNILDEIEKAKGDKTNGTRIETLILTDGKIDALQALVQKANADEQVILVTIGNRQLSTKVASTFKADSVKLIAYPTLQMDAAGIDNFLLKNYVGEELALAYKMPYKIERIKMDTLKVSIGSTELKTEDLKLNNSTGKNDKKELIIRILNRAVFKKYSDDVTIDFDVNP